MGSSASALAAGTTAVHAAAPGGSPPPMDAPTWVWLAILGGLAALLLLDLVIVDRRPHEVTTGEAARWVSFYIACAVAFGIGVWATAGRASAVEYFTGYVTEYSLSVDNLFVFMLIVSSFAVPRIHQHRVLLIGIVIALVMRGMFIAAGAALIANFVWIFFLFGAFLLWTAAGMIRDDDEGSSAENTVVRWTRKVFRVTGEYYGTRSVVKFDGKRWLTPMCVVIIAIGSADLLFAVDSIPAIFGITQAPFLVFTANAFALMGLRQLYFLIGGLVHKLVYLNKGLAVLLAFIGAKLILHALAEYGVVPESFDLGNWQSLLVIVAVLVVTTAASLAKSRRAAGLAAESEQDGAEPGDSSAASSSAASSDRPGPSQPGPSSQTHASQTQTSHSQAGNPQTGNSQAGTPQTGTPQTGNPQTGHTQSGPGKPHGGPTKPGYSST